MRTNDSFKFLVSSFWLSNLKTKNSKLKTVFKTVSSFWFQVSGYPSLKTKNSKLKTVIYAFLLLSCLIGLPASAYAATSITVGTNPDSVAVNPVTNRMYVSNSGSKFMNVIDMATNASTSIWVGYFQDSLAVNPITNKIYSSLSITRGMIVIDGATNTIKTSIDLVASSQSVVEVNPATNRIYVARYRVSYGYFIEVIDGATDSNIASIPLTNSINTMAVNPVTNKIYIAMGDDSLAVINGNDNSITYLGAFGMTPSAIGINPATNKIYVANYDSNSVTVINGADNSTTTVHVGGCPQAVAVNPVTNRIYVGNYNSSNVSVINGVTSNVTATVTDPGTNARPQSIAVNPSTNTIFVSNYNNTATVINGQDNTILQTISTGANPQAIGINPVTNKIGIANYAGTTIELIDGPTTTQDIPLDAAITPLPSDTTASTNPTFTFTASSTFAPTAPPVLAVYYQVDSPQGQWMRANYQSPGVYSGATTTLAPGPHTIYAFATDGQDATSVNTYYQSAPLIGDISSYAFTAVDLTPPTAAITYSPSGPCTKNALVTMTATFSEPMADAPVVQIAVSAVSGGTAVPATDMTKVSTTQYTYLYTCTDGNGNADVTLSAGTDLSGNVVQASPTSGGSFVIDNTPPVISSATSLSSSGTYSAGNMINVTLNFSKAINTSGLTINLNTGGAVAIGALSAVSSCTGTYTVAAGQNAAALSVTSTSGTITDMAGNNTANPVVIGLNIDASKTIIIDTTAPNAPIVSGVTPTNTNKPVWSWTHDAAGGNGTFRYRVDNSDMSGATTTTSLSYRSTSVLSDSTHTLYVQERDDVGNWSASGSFGVLVDTIAPSVNAGGTITKKAVFVPSATATDANAMTFSWTKTSGPGNVTFSVASALTPTISADADGIYVLQLTATDAAGNSASSNLNLTWDTNAPTVNAGSDQAKHAQFTQTGTATDVTSLTYSWTKVSGPGTITFGSPSSLSTTISANQDGTYTIRFMATDAAGNSASSDMTLIWDTVAPVVNAGGNRTVNAAFAPAAAASDTNALTYQWTKQSGPGNVTFSVATALAPTISADTDGSYVLRLTATDAAGNSAYSDMTLIWDTIAPVGSSDFQVLPQTGQTTCYDASGGLISCSTGTGQDGAILAGKAWPNPRFTLTSSGTGTVVTDNLTGFIWQQDGSTPTVGACTGGPRTWQQALDYVACLNSINYLGHNDWRLPNISELQSIVNYGQKDLNTWLDSLGFKNTQSSIYWSSTTYARDTTLAFSTTFNRSTMSIINKTTNTYYVRCVRGQSGVGNSVISLPPTGQTNCYDSSGYLTPCAGTGQDGAIQTGTAWPNPRFSVQNSGAGTVVSDNLTGLIWQQDGSTPSVGACTGGVKTWQGALDYASCLNTNNYLGHNDWRVPNINEISSLVNYGQSAPNVWLDANGFTNTPVSVYWSSDAWAFDKTWAWATWFDGGGTGAASKTGTTYVRCVRGPSLPVGQYGIIINGGASYTKSSNVSLMLSATDANGLTQMRFSNDNIDWSGAPVSYSTTTFYALQGPDGQKTVYVKFGDAAGNWSLVSSASITLDTTAPLVSSATSTTPDGYYKAGAAINISLTFSETVNSSGLTINLNSGGSVNTGPLSSVTSWSGAYTVGPNQNASVLTVGSIAGTITDPALNATTNPTILGGHNISDTSAIVIDTIAPTVHADTIGVTKAPFSQPATASDANPTTYLWSKVAGPGSVTFTPATGLTPTIAAGSDGPYLLRLTATDAAGNSASTDVSMTWDTTPPSGNSDFQLLPKTGQTNCYDANGNVISCATVTTGQDGAMQAGKNWPNPRFTDNGDGTVTDHLTGLMWQKDGSWPTVGPCGHSSANWQEALTYAACLSTNNYLGYNDWRVPNINELGSLQNSGQASTSIWLDSQGFTNTSGTWYWSSTTAAPAQTGAWIAEDSGRVSWYGKSSPANLRCVRGRSGLSGNSLITLVQTGQTTAYTAGDDGSLQTGSAWLAPRFSDDNDGTIFDKMTGLIWPKDGSSPVFGPCTYDGTWYGALQYVACLNANRYLGFNDWRLPNRIELRTLVNYGRANTASWLKTQGLSVNVWYWTSTTDPGNEFNAMTSALGTGEENYFEKISDMWSPLALPVRGGQYGVTGSTGIVINMGQAYTNTVNVKLTLSASDTNGIGTMKFSDDGTNWSAPVSYVTTTNYVLPSGDGLKTVYVQFSDVAGNWSASYSASITLDTATPVTTINAHPQNPSNTTNINFSFSANEGSTFECRIDTPSAALNGGAFQACGSPCTTWAGCGNGNMAFISDGAYTLYVRAIDQAGNVDPNPASYTWLIDTQPPLSAATPSAGNYNSTQSIVLSCNDILVIGATGPVYGGGGCSDIHYTIDGSLPSILSPTYTSPIVVSANTTVRYFARDLAGNSETAHTDAYIIDRTPPLGQITFPADKSTIDEIYFIEGTASDPGAVVTGVAKVELQVFNGTYYLGPTKTWRLTPQWILADGTTDWFVDTATVFWTNGKWYTLTARITDNAGNVTTTASRFYFYNGLPVATEISLTPSAQAIQNNGSVSLAGKLTRLPDIGTDLSNLPVTFKITDPDGLVTSPSPSTATYDAYGHYLLANLGGFTKQGAYKIQTIFSGNAFLDYAASDVKTVLVGDVAGYAIIVEGKIPATGSPAKSEGLETHNKTVNRIYRAFRDRGFTDDNIYLLKYPPQAPALADPQDIVVDGVPTKAALQTAVTGSAPFDLRNKLNSVPAPVYIVLVDHGSSGNFYIDTETVVPAELGSWLAVLESGLDADALANQRIIIDGSCYSGSFIPALSQAPTGTNGGRILITSAASDEESYRGPLESDGIRSGEFFLDELFKELVKGSSLKAAFTTATDRTRVFTFKGGSNALATVYSDNAVQHPLLDDNGDKKGSNTLSDGSGDGANADRLYLGFGATNAVGSPAEFTAVSGDLYLTTGGTATLWGTVGNNNEVDSAWIEVRPHSLVLSSPTGTGGATGQLSLDLDKSAMTYNSQTQRWEAAYAGFAGSGTYDIYYFTQRKSTLEVSEMRLSRVYKAQPGNNPPGPFNLTAPLDNSAVETMLVLTWEEATDPENDPVTYTVQISPVSDFTGTLAYRKEGLADRALILDSSAGLQDLTTYWWKVIAVDQYGNRQESVQTLHFRTNNTNGLPGIITGRVTDASSGAAVAGATITSSSGGSVTAASNGAYVMSVPTGAQTLSVSASGYVSASGIQVTAAAGGTVTQNIPLTSVAPSQYSLTVSHTGTGAVTSSPSGISCGATCAAPFAANSVVTLTAAPGAGYSFTGWSGACTGTGACAVTMSANKSVSAAFSANAANTPGAPNTATDGVCGSADKQAFTTAPTANLCSAGTPSTVTGTGPWSWTCEGTNGGSAASCSAQPTAATPVPDGHLVSTTVTVADALRVLRIAAGLITPTANDLAHGDVAPLVNGKPQPDGKIDINDAIVILRMSVGLVSW